MIFASTRPTASGVFTLLAGVSILTACGPSPSEFARTSSDAASTLSAAAATLRLEHEGRLTRGYAQASFLNYGDALEGLDAELRSSQGAPGREAIEQLLALYRIAQGVINEPCLDEGCDWRSQVEALERAKEAFQNAGEG
ncbi:MAG: hypothetical protein M3301_06165 [Chloroflexota bacterium]|nr:hypothetical protein [Chloroflexota bacterium]